MKFKIRNFGPIQEGFIDDAYMTIEGVTVFIGGQGTGKSSVAKAISTMMWLEKALVRNDFSEKSLQLPGRFKKHFSFHGIDDYFHKDTLIEYCGEYYSFTYTDEKLEITDNSNSSKILLPKIMYVPSERNFLSSLPKPSLVSELSPALATFLDEFESAKRKLSKPVNLPVKDGGFSYDKLNNVSWVERKGNKTRLSQASSGYQSVIPLFLVTNYLSDIIANEEVPFNVSNYRSLRKELESILNKHPDNDAARNNVLNMILSKYKPSYFVNIVEEPEQNLFPESQIHMLYSLMEYQNKQKLNHLIITTHSPYIINALSLAAACYLVHKKNDNQALQVKLGAIVPQTAWLDPAKLHIYQIDENGSISRLENYESLPSDTNYLNTCLGEFNEAFANILELEDSF